MQFKESVEQPRLELRAPAFLHDGEGRVQVQAFPVWAIGPQGVVNVCYLRHVRSGLHGPFEPECGISRPVVFDMMLEGDDHRQGRAAIALPGGFWAGWRVLS